MPSVLIPFCRFQQRVEEAAPAVLGDVIAALPVGEELDPLDEAGGLLGAGVQVQRGVVVAHAEGDLERFWVDEVHAAGERDSGHSGGGRREGAERARVVLNVAPGLNVVDVGAPELVVQRFDELILDRLGHVLHLFTLCSFRFARLTKSVEGRLREGACRALGAQRPPVASGLTADAVAVGAHRDGDLVDAEGRGLLPALTPDGAARICC